MYGQKEKGKGNTMSSGKQTTQKAPASTAQRKYEGLDRAIRQETRKEENQETVESEESAIEPLFQQIVQATKASNRLKPSDKVDKTAREEVGSEILETVSHLMNQFKPSGGSTAVQEYAERCQEPEGFDHVRDILDLMLEAADFYLDQAKGHDVNKQVSMVQEQLLSAASSSASTPRKKKAAQQSLQEAIESSQNINKPQDYFADAPVDNRRIPFIPKLQSNAEKYNALQPLKPWTPPDTENGEEWESAPHPYEYEIQQFMKQGYPQWMIERCNERQFPFLEDTELVHVSNVTRLHEMLEELESDSVKEIAVDLEAHSLRTFQGFVCLMQISTREKDYIVDTLLLREHLHVLNRVFTDPRKVKVLHGCGGDVVWLQRDFGLYLVNVFDTGVAAKALGYPSLGLAYLLEKFCNIDVDKSNQLADWRQRPLSEDLVKYAREDTHYLLDIMDRMKNELLDKEANVKGARANGDLLCQVLNESNQLTLKRYEKEEFRHSDWKNLAVKLGFSIPAGMLTDSGSSDNDSASSAKSSKSPKGIRAAHPQHLSHQQARVFAALFEWRDRLAREKDESPQYTLSRRALVRLSKEMPTSMHELSKCCNPLPPIVREHSSDVLVTIKKAKENKPTTSLPRRLEKQGTQNETQQSSGRNQQVIPSVNERKHQYDGVTVLGSEENGSTPGEKHSTSTPGNVFPKVSPKPCSYKLYAPSIPSDMNGSNSHKQHTSTPHAYKLSSNILNVLADSTLTEKSTPNSRERADAIRNQLRRKSLYSLIYNMDDDAEVTEDDETDSNEEVAAASQGHSETHTCDTQGLTHQHTSNATTTATPTTTEGIADLEESVDQENEHLIEAEADSKTPQSLAYRYNLHDKKKKRKAERRRKRKGSPQSEQASAAKAARTTTGSSSTKSTTSTEQTQLAGLNRIEQQGIFGGVSNMSAKEVKNIGKSQKVDNVYTVGGIEKNHGNGVSGKKAKRGKKKQRRAH